MKTVIEMQYQDAFNFISHKRGYKKTLVCSKKYKI